MHKRELEFYTPKDTEWGQDRNGAEYISEKPKISVILPVHNGDRFIESAVQSILAQDLEDFELLICNDGSSDRTADILHDLETHDSRIQTVSWPQQCGISSALNTLTNLARGEFIARMDADDISMPSRLGDQLEAYPPSDGTTVSFAACELIDEEGEYLGVYQPPQSDLGFHLRYKNPFIHPLLFTKTTLLRRFTYRDLPYAQDYDLYQRMWQAGVDFQVSSKRLLRYRMVENRLKDPEKMYSQLITASWVRRNFQNKVAAPELSDLADFASQYELTDFLEGWPAYVACSGKFFDSRWSGLSYLANYGRFDPLLKSEIRSSIRYRLDGIYIAIGIKNASRR